MMMIAFDVSSKELLVSFDDVALITLRDQAICTDSPSIQSMISNRILADLS